MVVPSVVRASGRFRARQVERILSGDEPRDDVSAFVAALVQDLRDVSHTEVPSSVAARHLLKMRLATEMEEGGPVPIVEIEEPALPPPRPVDRRRPALAAMGLAAAMVVMVGIAASISGQPSGTRAGSVVGSDVPRRPAQNQTGGLDRFIAADAQTTSDPGCGTTRLSALAVSLTGEVAPVLSRWPAVCPSISGPVIPRSVETTGGAAVDQPLVAVVTQSAAGSIGGTTRMNRSGEKPAGAGDSGGSDRGSEPDSGSGNNPAPGGGSGSGENPSGGETGGGTDTGPKAKQDGNGQGKGRGRGSDGPEASSDKPKGGKKKAER